MAKLKILRNEKYYPNRQEALESINDKSVTLTDGEIWVATYKDGDTAKSLFAIKRFIDDEESVTVLEDKSGEIDWYEV